MWIFGLQVASKPWTLTPDTNTGDLTKLCNHKRKIMAMASLDCKPPDPSMKLRKGKRRRKYVWDPCIHTLSWLKGCISETCAYLAGQSVQQRCFAIELIFVDGSFVSIEK
jgi:hypothetical protein